MSPEVEFAEQALLSIELAAVSLDTDAPEILADFYANLLGLSRAIDSQNFIALKGAGVLLVVQRIGEHARPTWPHGEIPKQLHLEFLVNDLDAAERRAVTLGALKASNQASQAGWRVMVDPAGHPFCFTALLQGV